MRLGVIGGLLLSPVLATLDGGGCGRGNGTGGSSAAMSAVDPWHAKLEQMRMEYEANEARMLTDWRSAMKDAQSGELDATKLDHEVQDLP